MPSLSERLARCSSTAVFDVLRVLGLPVHELPRTIRALDPSMKIAGPVYTVLGKPDPDISVHESLELWIRDVLSRSPTDHVIVCQPQDDVRSAMGDLSAEALRRRGIRGYVIDGGCRDADEVCAIGFPVFCRYTSPIDISGTWRLTHTNVPITIGKVEISPGDYLIGDRDGTLMIEKGLVERVVAKAEEMMSTDSRMRDAIRDGRDPYDAFLEFGKL